MVNLIVNVRSELHPSKINNIDIYIEQGSDVDINQYRILTDFPDHLNLQDGVVLSTFNVAPNENYLLIVRAFLNEPPYVIVNASYAFTSDEDVTANLAMNIE